MYTLLATPKMKNWLFTELGQYQVTNSNKYIVSSYSGTTESNDTFKINLYSSNIITINGSLKNRIYEKLFLNVGEVNLSGCDEVGVGDFFGPTVYVSVFFDEETVKKLSFLHLPIRDSKKLTDYEIFKIYNNVHSFLNFNSQIVYDANLVKDLNSIAQKTYYHHQNVKDDDYTIIDLFTTEKSFYKYSEQLNLTWPPTTVLETKADSIYMSVALASIIARALFLLEMDKLNEKYNMTFPLGCSNVKNFANDFIELYSKEELATFCKTTFKTFDEVG